MMFPLGLGGGGGKLHTCSIFDEVTQAPIAFVEQHGFSGNVFCHPSGISHPPIIARNEGSMVTHIAYDPA